MSDVSNVEQSKARHNVFLYHQLQCAFRNLMPHNYSHVQTPTMMVQSSTDCGVERSGRETTTLKQRFFSKEGQERKNEIGKRKTGNGTEGREWEILTKNN